MSEKKFRPPEPERDPHGRGGCVLGKGTSLGSVEGLCNVAYIKCCTST